MIKNSGHFFQGEKQKGFKKSIFYLVFDVYIIGNRKRDHQIS